MDEACAFANLGSRLKGSYEAGASCAFPTSASPLLELLLLEPLSFEEVVVVVVVVVVAVVTLASKLAGRTTCFASCGNTLNSSETTYKAAHVKLGFWRKQICRVQQFSFA